MRPLQRIPRKNLAKVNCNHRYGNTSCGIVWPGRRYCAKFASDGQGDINLSSYNLLSWLEGDSNINLLVSFHGAYNCTVAVKDGE